MTQTFTPHDYQREAMSHLFKLQRSALWMLALLPAHWYGTGKTKGTGCG